MNHAPYHAQMFGDFRLSVGGRQISRFRTRKTAALFAYLALNAGRTHPREYLAELIWPECDPEAGRHSLSMALSSIRQQIEAASGGAALLDADRYQVALRREAIWTDVAEFESALQEAANAHDEPAAIRHLAAAADVYSGELLSGFYEEWVFPEQQRLHELYVQALEGLVERLERQQDYRSALNYAIRAIRVDPFRISSHRDAIRLYLAMGEPDLAERQRAAMVRRFSAEGEYDPDAGETEPAPANAPTRPSRVIVTPSALEPPGGAMPLLSRFYVERAADDELRNSLDRRDGIVLITGARQTGKSSLLARGLQRARDMGSYVVYTHLKMLAQARFSSADALLLALAHTLYEQLELSDPPASMWDDRRGPAANLRRYLRQHVLASLDRSIVWALDEVDRVAQCRDADDVFGLIRSWHDERALDPDGPFGGLTLALAYSTEGHLLIADANQSPFNVGTRISLTDFGPEQVAELNRLHGSPLANEQELARLRALVGGQPYLVRLALYEMAARGTTLRTLLNRATDTDWVFGDHLMRVGAIIAHAPELGRAVRDVLDGKLIDDASLHRLRSAGILSGGTPRTATIRCGLYARYLSHRIA